MWCNQIFSLISDNKIQNLIVADNYEVANQLARNIFGNQAIAVDTTLYPVAIGDDYINGIFYHEGVEVIPNPTEEQEIHMLTDETNQLAADLDFIAMELGVDLDD